MTKALGVLAVPVLVLALPAVGGCGAVTPSLRLERPPSFQRGVALGLFAPDGPDAEAAGEEEALEELARLGASDVSFVITWVTDDVRASEVRADPAYTPSPARLVRLVRRAHALGLRVMLFPILRLVHRTPAEWRGVLQPGDRDRWFQSYGALVDELAALAAREKVETLSIGSELVSLEPEVERWRALAARVRGRFGGRLLYSANWDRYEEVRFWSAVDAIGVSGYWELARAGERPEVEELVRAWAPIAKRLVEHAARERRPVVLTEIGYPSVEGAAAAPWNDFLTGADGRASDEAQRRLFEAAARVWSREPALDGLYVWFWSRQQAGLGDPSYSPRGKAAEYVLREWYRGEQPVPFARPGGR